MKACAIGQLLRCPRGLQFGNALDDFLCHRLPIRSRKGCLALIKILLSTVPEGYFHNTVLRIIAQVFFTNKVNYLPCKITLFLGTFGGYPLIKLKQKLEALWFGFEILFAIASVDSFIECFMRFEEVGRH